MRLFELLRRSGLDAGVAGNPNALADPEIAGLCDDSRVVRPGDLFIARPGSKTDGSQFARDAVAKGAAAVVSQSFVDGLGVPTVIVDHAGQAIARLAAAFFDEPTKSLDLLGVTGTNGKTTTTYLVRHVLNRLGIRCGLVGTVEIDDGVKRVESNLTTPGVIELNRTFAAMRDNGCRAAMMEVSSHALDQGRVAGLRFMAGGFTNLTGDHLDYHKTMDAYAAAKAKLFSLVEPEGVCVVCVDSPWGQKMIEATRGRVITFATRSDVEADVRVESIDARFDGVSAAIRSRQGVANLELQLVGRHNVENALCAALICSERFGLSISDVFDALRDATGAPGRLERVSNKLKPRTSILVDYAHTDDALANVLKSLRPLVRGKLRVVFGCGGDRDRTKRPRMARVARELAHAVYVTSDNPRSENPAAIIDDILSGLVADERKDVVVEVDRRAAIRRAIAEAEEGDIVLIAGKGHEKYQILGQSVVHFDDVEEAGQVQIDPPEQRHPRPDAA